MNYRVTEHYARGNELFIAEFDQLNDANIFLTKKVLLDEADHKKIMYRLYHDTQLIRVSNKENIATTYAQYAEEDADITMTSALQFSVTTQIQNAPQHKIA